MNFSSSSSSKQRPLKRRKVDNGQAISTKQEVIYSPTLQSKDVNQNRYYLRSSVRNTKKRKLMSPIQEGEGGQTALKYKSTANENTKPQQPQDENTNPGEKQSKFTKISTIKNTIALALNKITSNKDKENDRDTHNNNNHNHNHDNNHNHNHHNKQKSNKPALLERTRSKKEPPTQIEQRYEYDEKGYIIFHKGLIMNKRYCVQRRLGKGTFSKVFACHDLEDIKYPKKAVKVIRNQHKYQIAARTELKILEYLKHNDVRDRYKVIKLIESSYFQSHPIFVFPLYGRSLYHYLYDNNFRPFPDSHIKEISKQIISAVHYVHSLGIIITDLKPENIIICNDASDTHVLGDKSMYYTLKDRSVRLIDFGSAVFDGPPNTVHQHLIQTRHYRAPEVMFKFNWSYPADIWSIGCVMVELIVGKMLFNTHDTIDHLNQIVTAIGPIPSNIVNMINENVYSELFNMDGQLALNRAKVSSVQCSKLKTYFHSKYHKHMYHLVKLMLDWNPETRISAAVALKHPLFEK